MGRFRLMVGFLVAGPAIACTMANPPTTREALKLAAVVFRGTVLKSEVPTPHSEMKGRNRNAVTLRILVYWKGDRGKVVNLYDVAPGTDCIGAERRLGREYPNLRIG